jgi:hypothetical protein
LSTVPFAAESFAVESFVAESFAAEFFWADLKKVCYFELLWWGFPSEDFPLEDLEVPFDFEGCIVFGIA